MSHNDFTQHPEHPAFPDAPLDRQSIADAFRYVRPPKEDDLSDVDERLAIDFRSYGGLTTTSAGRPGSTSSPSAVARSRARTGS